MDTSRALAEHSGHLPEPAPRRLGLGEQIDSSIPSCNNYATSWSTFREKRTAATA
jgi:hypothetical protein